MSHATKAHPHPIVNTRPRPATTHNCRHDVKIRADEPPNASVKSKREGSQIKERTRPVHSSSATEQITLQRKNTCDRLRNHGPSENASSSTDDGIASGRTHLRVDHRGHRHDPYSVCRSAWVKTFASFKKPKCTMAPPRSNQ